MKKKKIAVTTLRQSLSYEPVELAFGTSGLRGLVKDITNLETYVTVRGFLAWQKQIGELRPGATVYAAGDLRPSTSSLVSEDGVHGDILQAVHRAVADAGFTCVNAGHIPTPALILHAMAQSAPAIMVTGSHVPFDRNGIKFTRPTGEVRKPDEQPILAEVAAARNAEYERPAEQSIFDERGMLRVEARVAIPEEDPRAAEEYVHRYLAAFPAGALAGKTILVWEHSAVGRDLLGRVLRELGARVVATGRSETFIPVDTEGVDEALVRTLQELVDANGRETISAVVSTDGDSDRPLFFRVENGRLFFVPGDLLGLLVARHLGVRHVAVPVSVNDAVDDACAAAGVELVKTKIGSPYVIASMREAGWEGNGGFLTAAPLGVPGGGTLAPLPTRDALLPILCALTSAWTVTDLAKRAGRTAVMRDFPMDAAREIMQWLTPPEVWEASFAPEGITVRRADGTTSVLSSGDPLAERVGAIHAAIGRYFTADDWFPEVQSVNWMDGVRIRFTSGDVVHFRPSGNAPEMRLYAVADTGSRATELVRLGVSEDGIMRRMARDATDRTALADYGRTPQPLPLFGAPQNYAWGGYDFIPNLLGVANTDRRPYAELWLGAHPRGLAQVDINGTRLPLDRLIASDPWLTLGADTALRYAGRLPYLFKVLDVRDMASIQAHPSRAQAEEGFARENAAGVPIDAPQRLYRDENHKPEVHVALTEFWMLHGFRPLEEMAEVLSTQPELALFGEDLAGKLRGGTGPGGAPSGAGDAPGADPRAALLRDLYGRLMTMPQSDVDAILDPMIVRLESEESAGGLRKEDPGFWALRAARTFPLPGGHRDRGIFSIFLLNLVHLRPGQGTFQPAGTLHAYLEGADVELMANSDNVTRGGLTPKHVDVPELLATLSFRDGKPPVLEGRATSETSREYETPAEEFALERVEVSPGVPYSGGREHSADTLIVVEGAASVIAAGRTLTISRGGSAIVPAGVPYSIAARAPVSVMFKAGVPRSG